MPRCKSAKFVHAHGFTRNHEHLGLQVLSPAASPDSSQQRARRPFDLTYVPWLEGEPIGAQRPDDFRSKTVANGCYVCAAESKRLLEGFTPTSNRDNEHERQDDPDSADHIQPHQTASAE